MRTAAARQEPTLVAPQQREDDAPRVASSGAEPPVSGEEAVARAIGTPLTIEEPGAKPAQSAEPETAPKVGKRKTDIEKQCDALASQAHAVLDDTARLVTAKISALRQQLDELGSTLLKGTADAKAKIDDQMRVVAIVSELTQRIGDNEMPELRRLVSEVVRT